MQIPELGDLDRVGAISIHEYTERAIHQDGQLKAQRLQGKPRCVGVMFGNTLRLEERAQLRPEIADLLKERRGHLFGARGERNGFQKACEKARVAGVSLLAIVPVT